jgi:hypothetical protein
MMGNIEISGASVIDGSRVQITSQIAQRPQDEQLELLVPVEVEVSRVVEQPVAYQVAGHHPVFGPRLAMYKGRFVHSKSLFDLLRATISCKRVT